MYCIILGRFGRKQPGIDGCNLDVASCCIPDIGGCISDDGDSGVFKPDVDVSKSGVDLDFYDELEGLK